MMVLRVAVGKKISFAEHNKGTRYSDYLSIGRRHIAFLLDLKLTFSL